MLPVKTQATTFNCDVERSLDHLWDFECNNICFTEAVLLLSGVVSAFGDEDEINLDQHHNASGGMDYSVSQRLLIESQSDQPGGRSHVEARFSAGLRFLHFNNKQATQWNLI